MVPSTSFLVAIFCSLIASLSAFEITFPTANDYLVSCKENVLKWTYNSSDPDIFSVALLNANGSRINGNYQIANSLRTINGTANVTTNCVAPGDGYYLAFVNASHYSFNHPQVYYSSQTFSIKSNDTKPIDSSSRASGNAISANTADVDTTSTIKDTLNQAGSANPANPEKTIAKNTNADGAVGSQDAGFFSLSLAYLVCSAAISLLFLS